MPLELFVKSDDTFVVNFAVCADKKNPYTLYADVSVEKLIEMYGEEANVDTIESHSATFRRPSFSDMSKLYDEAFSWDGTQVKTNASSMRLGKMILLLKSWTLKNPATEQEVRQLNPVIALVLGSELDRLSP